jgi:hypothetical protein
MPFVLPSLTIEPVQFLGSDQLSPSTVKIKGRSNPGGDLTSSSKWLT